jgi:hypothetical protein
MFRFTQEPSSGSHFFCLAKTTVWFYILVDYDVVNVMAEKKKYKKNKKCFDTVDARCKHEDYNASTLSR